MGIPITIILQHLHLLNSNLIEFHNSLTLGLPACPPGGRENNILYSAARIRRTENPLSR